MEEITIKFARHQKLPEGYTVQWWESDEHYRWCIDDDNYSCAYASRWQAYRAAHNHSKMRKRLAEKLHNKTL